MAEYRLASFRFDVTPPLGHSLCGGWIAPAAAIDDPLEAVGLVLLGAGDPIVLCAVDWTGLLNEAYDEWREALARAAGTTPERVAVHCVHQHNAPLACLESERAVLAQGDLPSIIDLAFFGQCLDRGRRAVREALIHPSPVTHVAAARCRVGRVASNRRVFRNTHGVVQRQRASFCRDPELQALPEGPIDPWLRTVAFYNGACKLAACHYYATHPQSYYGDGRVNSDFAGMARKRRQAEEPGCRHLHFNGCAGDVSAGKYNDGSPGMRPILTQRIYEGIVASEAGLEPMPIERIRWNAATVLPPPRSTFSERELRDTIADRQQSVLDRNRSAFILSWLNRLQKGIPLPLSVLHVNDIALLHLPAECFIEYQLRAQAMQPSRFIAVAAYGDDGPWYIPAREEYGKGGYELNVAFCDPEIDPMLTAAISALLED